ncbi:MAG: alpha/beta fold hydrolase [Ornithinimicrobium sp.]
MTPPEPSSTRFHDLDAFTREPRLSGLAVNRDGSRLVSTLSAPNAKATAYTSALWEIDPSAQQPARRLTRSTEGEKGPIFNSSGDLLFLSDRSTESAEKPSSTSLWCMDAAGGEAHVVLDRPAGVDSAACASGADVVLLSAPVYPGVEDEAQQKHVHTTRADSGVDAILHTGYPVRFWDHDLGPAEPELFALTPKDDVQLLTAGLEGSLREHHGVISPQGGFVLTTATVAEAAVERRDILVRIDIGSGTHTRLIDDLDTDVLSVLISPDERTAVVALSPRSTPHTAPQPTLWSLDLATHERTRLAAQWDRWGTPTAWVSDGSEVLVLADDTGRGPVFAVTVTADDDSTVGEVRQVTFDDATYSTVVVPPAGPAGVAFGVRSSPAYPAEVVRIDLATGDVVALPGPADRPALPGTLTELTASAQDGTDLRAWLALPHAGNGPAPLLVFIHGGPLASSNAWTWRWNPWVLVAHGYAVLMPDPALSTGYGQDFVQRGWGAWGDTPYTDILALTDAACARDDIDQARTAALGGSFGGYMANWIAGHTQRFDAIVTHASLWALEGFGPTTDASFYWRREMTNEMAHANSPHRFVTEIATPMLVIHGDKDYRVPIGEGLRLWYELLSSSALPAAPDGSTPHRFLYFPNENHWIMAPQHAKVWYAVVTQFLNQHVLGAQESTPPVELGYLGSPPS